MFRTLARCNVGPCRQLVRGYKRRIPVRALGPGRFLRDPHWLDNWFRRPGWPMGWLEKELSDMMRSTIEARDRFWDRAAPWSVEGMNDSDLKVDYDEKDFKVTLDVSDYSPEELSLKIINDTITVTGKHEEKPDEHGVISREFKRQVMVPENVDLDTITCSVTPEGLMKVMGKVKGGPEVKEREVNIEREQADEKK